jgi:hypothetical protein
MWSHGGSERPDVEALLTVNWATTDENGNELSGSQKGGFSSHWETVNFSRRALLHGIRHILMWIPVLPSDHIRVCLLSLPSLCSITVTKVEAEIKVRFSKMKSSGGQRFCNVTCQWWQRLRCVCWRSACAVSYSSAKRLAGGIATQLTILAGVFRYVFKKGRPTCPISAPTPLIVEVLQPAWAHPERTVASLHHNHKDTGPHIHRCLLNRIGHFRVSGPYLSSFCLPSFSWLKLLQVEIV